MQVYWAADSLDSERLPSHSKLYLEPFLGIWVLETMAVQYRGHEQRFRYHTHPGLSSLCVALGKSLNLFL